jgi:Protein of unknown function (DUF3467)
LGSGWDLEQTGQFSRARPVVRRIGYSYPIAELPPDTKLVYANWARMNPTLLDLGIDFGYAQESGPPDVFPVRVTMSWEHAKILAGLLGQNIKAYEAQVREIPEFAEVEDVPDGD